MKKNPVLGLDIAQNSAVAQLDRAGGTRCWHATLTTDQTACLLQPNQFDAAQKMPGRIGRAGEGHRAGWPQDLNSFRTQSLRRALS